MGENPTEEVGPGDVEWDRIETLIQEEQGELQNQDAESGTAETIDEQKVGLHAGFWYLLDENDSAVSNGYHKITIPEDSARQEGVYKGWIGQNDYRIRTRTDEL